MQDLWQIHHQILSIIFLKEFIELNVNMDMMTKNVRLVGSNIALYGIKFKYYDCFLEYINGDLIEYRCLFCNKIFHYKFDEKLKDRFFNAYKLCNRNNKKFISLL